MERLTAIEGSGATVAEIMSRDPYCAQSGTRVEALAKAFLEKCVSSAPVIDGDGIPIGLVSQTELLRELRSRGTEPKGSQNAARRGAGGSTYPTTLQRTARDIMAPVVLCLPESASISHAAAMMAFEGVRHVPIIDAAGKIVGQVSTHDILRWMARREGYLIP